MPTTPRRWRWTVRDQTTDLPLATSWRSRSTSCRPTFLYTWCMWRSAGGTTQVGNRYTDHRYTTSGRIANIFSKLYSSSPLTMILHFSSRKIHFIFIMTGARFYFPKPGYFFSSPPRYCPANIFMHRWKLTTHQDCTWPCVSRVDNEVFIPTLGKYFLALITHLLGKNASL